MRAILLLSALLATGLLAPLAAADDDVGQVCLPQTDPDAPVYGCASWGTRSSPVYYYDVNSGPWTQDCVWLVCVTHPNPYVYPVVLTYAPIPYSEGDLYVKCLKGQYCHVAWDTRDPIAVTAAALPVLA
jgi:hypothetical protein